MKTLLFAVISIISFQLFAYSLTGREIIDMRNRAINSCSTSEFQSHINRGWDINQGYDTLNKNLKSGPENLFVKLVTTASGMHKNIQNRNRSKNWSRLRQCTLNIIDLMVDHGVDTNGFSKESQAVGTNDYINALSASALYGDSELFIYLVETANVNPNIIMWHSGNSSNLRTPFYQVNQVSPLNALCGFQMKGCTLEDKEKMKILRYMIEELNFELESHFCSLFTVVDNLYKFHEKNLYWEPTDSDIHEMYNFLQSRFRNYGQACHTISLPIANYNGMIYEVDNQNNYKQL